MHKKSTPYIRDPIHGFIALTAQELAIIDQPALQRLRNIKQMGFADLAFPGATHTRYNHSLGAMHVATQLFDSLFASTDLPTQVRRQFRQAIRLAMLLHDIGHSPLSHTTEIAMPLAKDLHLPQAFCKHNDQEQASHEDYTLKLVLDSPLTQALQQQFEDEGIRPEQIAALISGHEAKRVFTHNNLDYTPILQQIVSSECDADRMDYLRRDSFFAGVDYGNFDADWLTHNVVPIQKEGAVYLGILGRALFAFEDFLLSRYHMFSAVYLHHTPVLFSELLRRCFCSLGESFTLPADIEGYLSIDDITIWNTLRTSLNPWARLIVQRRPYYLLTEHRSKSQQEEASTDLQHLHTHLVQDGLEPVTICSQSTLAKPRETPNDLYVLTPTGSAIPLQDYTPLYQRYKNPARFQRVYVPMDQKQQASHIFKAWNQNEKNPIQQKF
ncbi:MAG: HD domain-containing protein [Myxococcota bacterium]